jgi:hypothetical protein
MKLVKPITTCLNGTYITAHIGKYLSYIFPIQNDLKQGDALLPLFFAFALEHAIKKNRET